MARWNCRCRRFSPRRPNPERRRRYPDELQATRRLRGRTLHCISLSSFWSPGAKLPSDAPGRDRGPRGVGRRLRRFRPRRRRDDGPREARRPAAPRREQDRRREHRGDAIPRAADRRRAPARGLPPSLARPRERREKEKLVAQPRRVGNKTAGASIEAMQYLVQKKGDEHTIAVFTNTWVATPLTSKEAKYSVKDLTPRSEEHT